MAGKRIVALGLFALVALTLGLFATSDTEAGTYKPTNIFSYLTNNPAVASNNTVTVTINAPDYNYEDSSMYNFAPIAGHPVSGALLPIGAWMGHLTSSTTLGLLNSACNQTISPYFDLYNATTATAPQLTPAEMAWTNTATPPPDVNPANGIPDYLEKYPHFLNLMLDPDGAGVKPPLVPYARIAGHAMVSTSWMLIEVVTLSPGQIAQLPGIKAQMGPELGWALLTVLNNPVDQIENPGAVSDFCTYLQSVTTMYGLTKAGGAYGVAGGATSQVTPPDNSGILATDTHLNRTYSQSERDFDNDGWENDMDPCFYIANPGWNPRTPCTGLPPTKAGDIDCDGLPDVCDPAPAVANPDQDADGYNNQQDICPLVADGPLPDPVQNQLDSDGLVGNADLGPQPDSIGNACDDSDNDGKEDGSAVAPGTAGTGNCRDGIDNDGVGGADMLDADCLAWTDKAEITAGRTQLEIFGTNPGTGLYFHAMPWAAVCLGDTDTDLDGYCDTLECVGTYPASCTSGLVSNPAVANSKPESLVIDGWLSGVGANVKPTARVPQSCTDGVDNDADTKTDLYDNGALGCDPTVASYAGDGDRDGVPDASDNCGSLCQIPNPEQHDADLDGKGDACDADSFVDMTTNSDADSFVDRCDNCPTTTSEDQTDLDFDRQGNVCDLDDDGDGSTDTNEAYLLTDPLDACTNGSPHDAWPLDNGMDKFVTMADVNQYAGRLGTHGPPSPSAMWRLRLDLSQDNFITMADVNKYAGKLGSKCN